MGRPRRDEHRRRPHEPVVLRRRDQPRVLLPAAAAEGRRTVGLFAQRHLQEGRHHRAPWARGPSTAAWEWTTAWYFSPPTAKRRSFPASIPTRDFTLTGVYRFDTPMSKHSVLNYGGDLYVLLPTGVTPMTAMIKAGKEGLETVDRSVVPIFLQHSINFRDQSGWQLFLNPNTGRLFANMPLGRRPLQPDDPAHAEGRLVEVRGHPGALLGLVEPVCLFRRQSRQRLRDASHPPDRRRSPDPRRRADGVEPVQDAQPKALQDGAALHHHRRLPATLRRRQGRLRRHATAQPARNLGCRSQSGDVGRGARGTKSACHGPAGSSATGRTGPASGALAASGR